MSTDGINENIRYRNSHLCQNTGTFLTGPGTLISGVAGVVIKVHQYTLSVLGTLAYSLNDSKPTGGTLDFGGYLSSGVANSPAASIVVSPFAPYPDCVCKTSNVGSALCLGTWVTAPNLGTVYFHALYTATDVS